MVLSQQTLLFFDASSLVAAAGSPTGGSAFLLLVCQKGFLRASSSQGVLIEAERNIRGMHALSIFQRAGVLTIVLPASQVRPVQHRARCECDPY